MSTVIIISLLCCIILLAGIIVLKKCFPDLRKVSLKLLGVAGPTVDIEFKDQLNKLAKATEDESQIQPDLATLQSLPPLQQRVKQLEKQNEILTKQLLGTSTVAVSTATSYLDPQRIAYFKQIRDEAFKHVAESDIHSDVVEYAYPLIRECSTCYSFKQIPESGKGICKKDQLEHRPGDVCDDWESHPKS